MQAKPAAVSDVYSLIVERVAWFGQTLVHPARWPVQLGGALHIKGFMRTFGVELRGKVIELRLLLQAVHASGTGSFFLESQMHALVPPVLLAMTGLDALDLYP